MKNGEFKKEGSINELKRDYGGFSVKLKLKGKADRDGFDEVDSITSSPKRISSGISQWEDNTNINIIKDDVDNCFRNKAEECEVKDEHSVSILGFVNRDQVNNIAGMWKIYY